MTQIHLHLNNFKKLSTTFLVLTPHPLAASSSVQSTDLICCRHHETWQDKDRTRPMEGRQDKQSS